MIKTAIILAGGLGTRLRSAVADLPKCLAPIHGIPFISFIIHHLKNEGIENFIFSLGYMSGAITSYLDENFADLQKKYVIETKQLGTGGAINVACKEVKEKNVLVVNGDTLFAVSISGLALFHEKHKADCTIALKEMKNFDRYGVVELHGDHSIKAFREKQFSAQGAINGGVYVLNLHSLLAENYPEIFSFEKDYLEKNTGIKRFYGIVNDIYFIDIGIPEDYQRFQDDYAAMITKYTSENKPGETGTFLPGSTTWTNLK